MLGGVMLIHMVFEKTDKSHLWYLVKFPLVFLNSGHTFSGLSSHLLKRLSTLLPLIHITQPPQHEALFFLTASLGLRPQSIFQQLERCPFFYIDRTAFCLVTKLCLKLKGRRNERLDRDQPPHLNIVCLSRLRVSQLTPPLNIPSTSLWTLTRFSVLTCVGEAFEKVSRVYNIWHITICFRN